MLGVTDGGQHKSPAVASMPGPRGGAGLEEGRDGGPAALRKAPCCQLRGDPTTVMNGGLRRQLGPTANTEKHK